MTSRCSSIRNGAQEATALCGTLGGRAEDTTVGSTLHAHQRAVLSAGLLAGFGDGAVLRSGGRIGTGSGRDPHPFYLQYNIRNRKKGLWPEFRYFGMTGGVLIRAVPTAGTGMSRARDS